MLMFQKIRARCGLFRSGTVQLRAAPPSADTVPGLTLAQVRLSTVGVSLALPPLFNDRVRGGRR